MPILSVEIFNDGECLDTRERPLRRIPDGRLGVVFEGAVFPIIDGRRIDVSGRWFYPNECPVLLEPPAEWNEVAGSELPFRWEYDTSGYYAYIFLDGDGALQAAALTALEDSGFLVSRSGQSFRDAPDGARYDWFLRLAAEGAVKPSRWEITQALARAPSLVWAADGAGSRPITMLETPEAGERASAQLVEWQGRVSSAERSAVHLEEALATIRAELEGVRNSAAREQAKLADQAALLRAALEEHKFQADGLTARERDVAGELQRINRELVAAREGINEEHHTAVAARADLDAAMSGWAEADEGRRAAREELCHTLGRLEDAEAIAEKLREAVGNQASVAKAGERGRKARREELTAIMATLLPRLELIAGSIDFTVEEVFDKRHLFGDLRALHDAPDTLPSKRLGGAERWLERHFGTGRSDDGRIYFRKRGDGRYDVLISDKAAQRRDIDRLKGL